MKLGISTYWKNHKRNNCYFSISKLIIGDLAFYRFVPKLPFFFFNMFIYLTALGLSCGIFWCDMWDVVPWSGIEPGLPALGAQSLSHWTTREIPSLPYWWLKLGPSSLELLGNTLLQPGKSSAYVRYLALYGILENLLSSSNLLLLNQIC